MGRLSFRYRELSASARKLSFKITKDLIPVKRHAAATGRDRDEVQAKRNLLGNSAGSDIPSQRNLGSSNGLTLLRRVLVMIEQNQTEPNCTILSNALVLWLGMSRWRACRGGSRMTKPPGGQPTSGAANSKQAVKMPRN